MKNQEVDISKFRIGVIQFAFNNSALIHLLNQRGNYIKAADFVGVKAVEDQISKLKNENYDTFVRPVCAFITFEYDDAFNRALKFKKAASTKSGKARGQILGHDLVMK